MYQSGVRGFSDRMVLVETAYVSEEGTSDTVISICLRSTAAHCGSKSDIMVGSGKYVK